jgi:hypothetical protein
MPEQRAPYTPKRKRKVKPAIEEPVTSKSGNYGFAKLSLGAKSDDLPPADTTWTVTLTVPEGAIIQYALFMVIHAMEQHMPPQYVEDMGGGMKRINIEDVTDPEAKMAASMLTLANDTLNTVLDTVLPMVIRATPQGQMVVSAVDLSTGEKPS